MRQALTESLLLALAGCGAALLLAWWGEAAVLQFLPAAAGDPFDATPDTAALVFTIAVAVVAALLFGLAPAWQSTAVDPAESIKSGGAQGGRRHTALRQVLVVGQVAFSVMLVAMAGLFGHSLAALRSVDIGFRDQNAIAFTLEMPGRWKEGEIASAREQLLARLETLPGVSMVSFGMPGPFKGGFSTSSVRVPGSELTAREPAWLNTQRVAPRYFEIIGSSPAAGREFAVTDTDTAPKVALVNQAFVRALLPGETHPLDRVLNFSDDKPEPVAIVGVVRDIPHQGLREKIVPTVYLPVTQSPAAFGAVLLRSQRSATELAPAIRREVERLGPEVSATEPATIRHRIDESIFQDRLVAMVGGFFGGLALLLAAIGLYGVMAYAAARRAREIGIRIALGAKRGEVLWMVLRGSLALVSRRPRHRRAGVAGGGAQGGAGVVRHPGGRFADVRLHGVRSSGRGVGGSLRAGPAGGIRGAHDGAAAGVARDTAGPRDRLQVCSAVGGELPGSSQFWPAPRLRRTSHRKYCCYRASSCICARNSPTLRTTLASKPFPDFATIPDPAFRSAKG